MRKHPQRFRNLAYGSMLALTLGGILSVTGATSAQQARTVEFPNITGGYTSTKYVPADQINASNFNNLKVAWNWKADTDAGVPMFGEVNSRGIPIYVEGLLITVSGPRRTVSAINPTTGKTVWTFQEPATFRQGYSPRNNHGKGVAYAKIGGRGVVFVTTPAFFLHALDAKTGEPLQGFGSGIPLPGFPKSGSIDVVKDVIEDWGPWVDAKQTYDPDKGLPIELGFITSSSPPLVVNDVLVVNNSAEQGYNQTRIENVPGDIVAYDAKSGKKLWKFHVLPRPGEFGHDTWENDAWKWTGDISSWAPLSADPERGLVYIPTNGATIDYYGGFRPGDNLFSTSIIALDVKTGKRVWHQQTVKHDIWNYDNPTAPILLDVNVSGRRIPGLFQVTKQGYVYSYNRLNGEPIWPIVMKPAPQSKVPGEKLPAMQPHPTKPAPFEMQGRKESDLIDYTPEIKAAALEEAKRLGMFSELFEPPVHKGNAEGRRASYVCPGGGGGANITGPPAADPENNILFIPTINNCSATVVQSGKIRDTPKQTGKTISPWSRGDADAPPARPAGPNPLQGIPSIWKGYLGHIVAIDMNTGEHLWNIPHGDTATEVQEAFRNNPLLKGVKVDTNIGRGGHPAIAVTPNLLFATGITADNKPHLFGIDKKTGKRVGSVEVPALGQYGMSIFMHEGKQMVVLPVSGGYTALALP